MRGFGGVRLQHVFWWVFDDLKESWLIGWKPWTWIYKARSVHYVEAISFCSSFCCCGGGSGITSPFLSARQAFENHKVKGCYGSYTKTQRIHFICFLTDGIEIRQQMHLGNTNEAYVWQKLQTSQLVRYWIVKGIIWVPLGGTVAVVA